MSEMKTRMPTAATVATNGGNETSPRAAPDATPAMVPTDAVLGQVVWLMMQMPAYRHVFLADLEWMVMPPLLLNQYRLFRIEGRIAGFAAWASLSEAAEARLQEPNPRLAPADWKSGDLLWLVNLFAPSGHAEAMLNELQETLFAQKSFKMHRRGADGKATVVTVASADDVAAHKQGLGA